MEILPNNPLSKLGNFKSSMEPKKDIAYYTTEEYQRFIAAAKKCALSSEENSDLYEWNYYIFFTLAFFTGLRKGEIHALQWDDIDGEHISVSRSIA